MPHAALWVVQQKSEFVTLSLRWVSMPHAALWVVQLLHGAQHRSTPSVFQCRTRLCGWCNCIARSPCPPRGKKPFWKVSENLSVLTENM